MLSIVAQQLHMTETAGVVHSGTAATHDRIQVLSIVAQQLHMTETAGVVHSGTAATHDRDCRCCP